MCIQRFGGETEGSKTFGKLWCRWDDSIGIGLQEIGWSMYLEWTDVAEDRDRG
jgi:hypothetical protein